MIFPTLTINIYLALTGNHMVYGNVLQGVFHWQKRRFSYFILYSFLGDSQKPWEVLQRNLSNLVKCLIPKLLHHGTRFQARPSNLLGNYYYEECTLGNDGLKETSHQDNWLTPRFFSKNLLSHSLTFYGRLYLTSCFYSSVF